MARPQTPTPPTLTPPTPAPLTPLIHRLWCGAIAVLLFLATLAVGNAFLPDDRRLTPSMVGHDFLAFYTAGTFVRENRERDLYRLDRVRDFQHALARREGLETGPSYGPFWNPPFYAWVFVPLAALPYRIALGVWESINVACWLGACYALVTLLRHAAATPHERPASLPVGLAASAASEQLSPTQTRQVDRRLWGLVPVLMACSLPFIQSLTHGQNTMTSLLVLSVTLLLWQRNEAYLAGLAAGLLLYKPQLGAVVAAALVLTLGGRALLGLMTTATLLALVTLATLPGLASDYQALLPHNLRLFQVEQPYLWDRHATLRAFWRLLLQGRQTGEMWPLTKLLWLASCAAVGATLVTSWWRLRRDRVAPRDPRRLTWMAAVVVAMPAVMPFYFDYDLLLVSAAATLCAAAALQAPRARRPVVAAWVALFAWLIVNSTVARLTHVNGTVLLLVTLATLLAADAAHPAVAAATEVIAPARPHADPQPLAVAA